MNGSSESKLTTSHASSNVFDGLHFDKNLLINEILDMALNYSMHKRKLLLY